ncbi:MAG: NAD(P)H-dependent glycerol-3-phosphate dehydrogenase, partial [Proteobacteria bacterium]|nr:NAD(P)H-dependent glycerol-3-phosphate dehydrogenase [Pseudomonadota bacterium]
MNLNVGILGGGSWGTTVAALVARNTSTMLWARDPATAD